MCDTSLELIHRSDVVLDGGDATSLGRDARRGTLVRLAAGVFVREARWNGACGRHRHIALARAVVSRLGPSAVLSHGSALAVHGFPVLGDRPSRVHVLAPRRTTAKVSPLVHQHAAAASPPNVEVVAGLRVVPAARAAVDVARVGELRAGVVPLDHGLHVGAFDRAELEAVLAAIPRVPGSRRAAAAVAFADGRSESPGESISRVAVHTAGLAAPVLQQRFPEHGPTVGVVDFWWPEFGVVGEFDGEVKYRDREMRGGRSPEQVVVDEKNREDALRALPEVRTVVRWTWSDALRAEPLVRALVRAGVR